MGWAGSVLGRRGIAMSYAPEAIAALMTHAWPGNVREMRNVVERAAALSDGPVITRADLVFGREMGPSVLVSHDLAQAGALEQTLERARCAETERARLAGQRRRELRAPADDRDRHREARIPVGCRVDDRADPAAGPQRAAHAGQRAQLVGEVDQSDARDRRVETDATERAVGEGRSDERAL